MDEREKAFVKRVRKRLIDLEWKQRTLAQRLGVDESYVSMLLNGKRAITADLKRRITDVMGL